MILDGAACRLGELGDVHDVLGVRGVDPVVPVVLRVLGVVVNGRCATPDDRLFSGAQRCYAILEH